MLGRFFLETTVKTIAQQIADNVMSYADATNEADLLATGKDQDWHNATTLFLFKDGSVLKACYPHVEAIHDESRPPLQERNPHE